MSKVKVLFVVAGFYRAGAERFAFEIDSALNKDKFDLTILALEKEGDVSQLWGVRYYEERHKLLGTKIKYIDDFINQKYLEKDRFRNRIKRRLNLFPRNLKYWKSEFYKYLNEFDVIHWMGEYIYINAVPEIVLKKSLIHMMTAKFQKRSLYDAFDHDLPYNFCTPFKDDELKVELSQFKKYNTVFVPLVLDTKQKNKEWKFQELQPKKIGIFTRLNSFKPLDPFFYSYQLLLDQMPNCELHIFGTGDPLKEGMIDSLERLGIRDRVFFRGHQEDIVKTALSENLSLSWFQGYNNDRPAGYAGIDICTIGLPLICWDFYATPTRESNVIYPHFKNLNQFVSYTVDVLTEKKVAEELSLLQYEDVMRNRNIKDHISVIENEYIRITNG